MSSELARCAGALGPFCSVRLPDAPRPPQHACKPARVRVRECMRGARQALLRLDRPWLPQAPGYSMYIRPVAFSSAGSLGMAPPARTTLMILLSPAGPYFETGAPLRLLAGKGGDGCECVCGRILPVRV